jgi:glycosyltransferase involved in cell wall biosynthesis
MVPTDIWRAVDGLSEDLFRTGLEDTDLSLKIRNAGYKVVYAPQAVTTLHPGAKHSQPKQGSASQFKRRWSHSLQQRPSETSPLRTAMDFGISDRVLFIDQQVPRIDVDAGSYAAIQEMRLFQALGYKVTFLPLNLQYAETYVKSLERIGVEVIYAPFASSVEDVLRERGDEFRLVYVTRHHVARAVVPFVRRFNPQAKIVFNNADLHFLRELRTALALNDGELLRRSQLTRDLELEIMRVTDLTVSYNEVEHAVILSHNLDQTRIAKAPWVVTPAESVAPLRVRSDIGFLGSFGHKPNVDALKFFAQDVMPLLRQSRPDIRLNVFGSQIGSDMTGLENEYVTIKGHVSDLADAFDPIKVFVAPLTAGAGLKGKVLNAMAHGVPTVLSPAAAEGIGALAGSHYLSAQSPEEWVSAIAQLDGDEALWNAISQNALEFVKANYSFETGVKTLRAALEKIDIFPAPTNEALFCKTALPPLR